MNQEGYIDEETVLLDVSVREKLQAQYPIGILTGRPRAEAEIALERVGLFLDPDLIVAMEDWDNSKPQPEALMKLAEIFEARALVYVGDTLDDVRMTQNANHAGDDRRYYGFGTLTGGLNGEEGRRKFLEEGAHTVIKSVNELLNYLE